MIYSPESFYKNEYLNMNQLQARFEKKELVSFSVSHWDCNKKCLVTKFNDGIVGYLPEDQLGIDKLKFIGNFDCSIQANSIIKKNACALITKIEGNKVFLSRKELQEEVLKSLAIGQTYVTQIKSVTKFGIFVDIAVGIIGFIHNSEITKTIFNYVDDLEKDYNLFRGKLIPAKILSLENEIKMSFRQTFNFPLISRGDSTIATVRNKLIDGTGYFVEISLNDTAIVDTDLNLNYGEKIFVQVKSTDCFFDGQDLFNKHHVKFIC